MISTYMCFLARTEHTNFTCITEANMTVNSVYEDRPTTLAPNNLGTIEQHPAFLQQLKLPPLQKCSLIVKEKAVCAYNYPPRRSDWYRIKPVFVQLYGDKDKTLLEIKEELQFEHGFRASVNMLKKHVALWGLGRNLRQNEVEHILGIHAQRSARGKSTYFQLRGQEVELECVYQFVRRKGIRVSQAVGAYNSGLSKPCLELRVSTPLQANRPLSSREESKDRVYETLLHEYESFMFAALDQGWLSQTVDGLDFMQCETRKQLKALTSSISATLSELRSGNLLRIRSVCLLLESAIPKHTVSTWLDLSIFLSQLAVEGFTEIVSRLLAHIESLCTVAQRKHNPLVRFVGCFAKLPPEQFPQLLYDCGALLVLIHEKVRPHDLRFQLRAKINHRCSQLRKGVLPQEGELEKLLIQCCDLVGWHHTLTLKLATFLLTYCDNLPTSEAVKRVLLTTNPCSFSVCECGCGMVQLNANHLSLTGAWHLWHILRTCAIDKQAYELLVLLQRCKAGYNLTLDEEFQLLLEMQLLVKIMGTDLDPCLLRRVSEIEAIMLANVERARLGDHLYEQLAVVAQLSPESVSKC